MGLKLTIFDTTGRKVVITPDTTSIKDQEVCHSISASDFDEFIKQKPTYTKVEQEDLKTSLLKQVNAEPELSILALADWHEEFYEGSDRDDIVYGLRQLEMWKRMPVERTVRFQNTFGDFDTWIWEPLPPLTTLAKASHYLPPVCFHAMTGVKTWFMDRPMSKQVAIMLAAEAIGHTREFLQEKRTLPARDNTTARDTLSLFGLSEEQVREFFNRYSVNPRDHYRVPQPEPPVPPYESSASPLQDPDVDEYDDSIHMDDDE